MSLLKNYLQEYHLHVCLQPAPFETLTTALERHRSLSPQVRHYPPRPDPELIMHLSAKQPNSTDPFIRHSTATSSSGTTSPSSGDSSPKPQSQIPGHFIDPTERAGLPGIEDSDGYARTEAARVVRSHTRTKFRGLDGLRRGKENIMDRRKAEVGGDRLESGSAVGTDVEHDAGMSTDSRPMGGGILSALLALHNQENSSSASSPSSLEHLPLDVPPGEPWVRGDSRTPTTTKERPRGRRTSILSAALLPASSSRESSANNREGHDRGGKSRKKTKIQFPPSTLFSGSKLPQAKSDAGVFGPLIASTGNLMGAAAPVSSGLQPDVDQPGYRLSRFVSCANHSYSLNVLPYTRYSWDTKSAQSTAQELKTISRPQSISFESRSFPGTRNSSPSRAPSPALVGPVRYKTKWTGVLKDLPNIGYVKNSGSRSGVSTPGWTPSPTLDGEDFFETKKHSEENGKKEKKRKRKKAEIFVCISVPRYL